MDTLLLIGGIHIGGSMTKHLGKLKEKQATGNFSIQDYVELRRICTRNCHNKKSSKNRNKINISLLQQTCEFRGSTVIFQ